MDSKQAPDFDAEGLAADVVDDWFEAGGRDGQALYCDIVDQIRFAYAAGQQAARRQDIDEIRATAALQGMPGLAVATLAAMADRLAGMLKGGR